MHYFIIAVLLIFSGCSSSVLYNYQSQKKQLDFKVASASYVHHTLQQPQFSYQFDSCTSNSYTIEDKSLFVEHIDLNSNCKWNGSANGFFEYQIKEKLKLKSMVALERLEKGNYIFSTLKVNEQFILKTIHIWGVYQDTFILDYDGQLSQKLLETLHVQSHLKNTLPFFAQRYNQSLVRMNFIKGYFNQESEVIIE